MVSFNFGFKISRQNEKFIVALCLIKQEIRLCGMVFS